MVNKVENTIETTIECENCECEIEKGEQREYESDFYCEDCFCDLFLFCDVCNEYCPQDDIVYIESAEEYVCNSCFELHYFRCDDCEGCFSQDDEMRVDCRSICDHCYCESYFTCDSCVEVYHNDYYGGDGYCENCYEENSSGLHNYCYKPDPVFYGKSDLYFGIELEIESSGQDVGEVVDGLPDYFYAKEDSSLDDGFEIVSHPASWGWLSDNKKKWDQIFSLRDSGFLSYNTTTCGMHVHMSKKAFSSLHLYKFLKMFFENQSFILSVSRRKLCNLNQYASLELDESIVYKATKKTNSSTKRYTAVNLENSDTVEVRIFRGTLAPSGFWRNLEFCKAVFDYTKDASIKDVVVTEFCSYVESHQKEYPNLYRFLCDKNFLPGLFKKEEKSKCA